MSNTLIIIGAGMAGLSTGCYAQMNGFRSQILEMHDKPGGLCTAWTRRGYTFDGCIHHLAGTHPDSPLFPMWQELGALCQPILYPDDLTSVEDASGQRVVIYADLERLEEHLKGIAPKDSATIDDYLCAVRRFQRIDLMGIAGSGAGQMLKRAPGLPTLARWSRQPLACFAARFHHPLLQQAFRYVHYSIEGVPAGLHLAYLAGCVKHDMGYPAGGSLAFSRAIANRYVELGGEIRYRARVTKILVERGRAVGVRLEDGAELRADIIVSAADLHSTTEQMLDGRFTPERLRAYYAAAPETQEFAVQVSFGVARDLSGEPHAQVYLLDEPRPLAGALYNRLDLQLYHFDPSLTPVGKSVIKVELTSRYTYWKALAEDPARYRAAKSQLAQQILALLEPRFPGLRAQVEVVGVATPITTERRTGNYRGLQVWAAPGKPLRTLLSGLARALPGLEGLHLAGQWAGGVIGLPMAAAMGRNLVRDLCRRDGRRFVTAR